MPQNWREGFLKPITDEVECHHREEDGEPNVDSHH